MEVVHLVWGITEEALDLSRREMLRDRSYLGTPIPDTAFALDGDALGPSAERLARACARAMGEQRGRSSRGGGCG